MEELTNINQMELGLAVKQAGALIIDACFWMSLGLLFIAFVDVPLQRYQINKRLKMSKQEVKDEMKDAEGRPEVKAQIRRRQRQMANNRMMAKVKDADVVIISRMQRLTRAQRVQLNVDTQSSRVTCELQSCQRLITPTVRQDNAHGFHATCACRS